MLTFTTEYKKELLDEELSLLIKSCDKQRLAVNSLITSYYRFFGHKIYSRNFGFQNIQSLINGLDTRLFKVNFEQGLIVKLFGQETDLFIES